MEKLKKKEKSKNKKAGNVLKKKENEKNIWWMSQFMSEKWLYFPFQLIESRIKYNLF